MADNPRPDHRLAVPTPQKPADASRFCPNCSSEMRESRCKLKCETCGFFLSCNDFY